MYKYDTAAVHGYAANRAEKTSFTEKCFSTLDCTSTLCFKFSVTVIILSGTYTYVLEDLETPQLHLTHNFC